MKKKIGIKKTLIAVCVLSTMLVLSGCGLEAQLGVGSGDIEMKSAPTTSMSLNCSIVANEDQEYLINAFDDEAIHALMEYKVDDTISTMSIYSLTVEDNEWKKTELLKDTEVEGDKDIPMYFGYHRNNNKVAFSVRITKKDKDVPGQTLTVGPTTQDIDKIDEYMLVGSENIKKGEIIPTELRLYGTQESLDKLRTLSMENLSSDDKALDYFLDNPEVLAEYDVDYRFLAVMFE